MKKKIALITGITGQDGSYLAEYLLARDYTVYGLIRRQDLEVPETNFINISHLLGKLTLIPGSLESYPTLFSILNKIRPTEIYHFAAQSFVSFSLEDEFSTMETNSKGTHHLISAIHQLLPECRFYFAGSSEMFGDVLSAPQDETTPFRPRSIYGISKVVGYELTRNYREQKGMFACSGILYNHESPRRGPEFVTRKITMTAAKIKLGMAQKLELGNIEAKRDWGFAGDYIVAIHQMLQLEKPEDFVIGTGMLHSVRDFLSIAFGELDLDYKNYVEVNPLFIRPSEKINLVANAAKAFEKLGWAPRVKFEELVQNMVRHDYNLLKKV